MRRPAAAATLARIAQMTSDASLARAHDEGRLALRLDDADLDRAADRRLRALAAEDRGILEEARALAAARGWPLGRADAPYGWVRLRDGRLRDVLPELVRILSRDVFELEGAARELVEEDDDVASFASRAASARRSAREALTRLRPDAALPGAK